MSTTTTTLIGPGAPEPEEGRGTPPARPETTRTAARLQTNIDDIQREAAAVDTSVIEDPRGQYVPLTEGEEHRAALDNKIVCEIGRGSLRHHTVEKWVKVVTLLFLVVIDFPVMLWLASSVFNVDWTDPWGLPLAISVVISILGTGGAAWALYHLGHNRRESKNDRRQLEWSKLSAGAKISLIGVGLLVSLIGVVMFVRVYTEGVLSGLDGLALLLAVLVALVMLLAAALVFFTAFRDGSPEQDDLKHYSTRVRAARQRQAELTAQANRLTDELAMLRRPTAARAGNSESTDQPRTPIHTTPTTPATPSTPGPAAGRVNGYQLETAADRRLSPGPRRPYRLTPRPTSTGRRRPLT